MKRRSFLKNIPGAAATTVIGGHALFAEVSNPMVQALHGMMFDTDRVMVIVQLNGGSDGLNTIFPLDQYDQLKIARGNMLIYIQRWPPCMICIRMANLESYRM